MKPRLAESGFTDFVCAEAADSTRKVHTPTGKPRKLTVPCLDVDPVQTPLKPSFWTSPAERIAKADCQESTAWSVT